MVSLTDSASNETEFAFDLDGRLAEVNHPVEDLQTRYRYDLVGKLLESRVALGEDELFKLNYSYNLAGERLSQHSVWEDGGNAFEYRLDASGRLIRESINRFVCDGVQDYAEGVNDGTAFALDGKLRLLARDDDFSATYLDLQRWEIAISEPVATSVSMVQNDGLRWRTSVGETLRNGRVLPAGTPIDSSNVAIDYPHIADVQVADTVGWFEGRMLLRHRMPLTGAFDVQIALSDFDVFGASIGLGVTRDRFETADGANRFPTDLGGVIDANGCDIVVEKDTDFLARFNDEELVDVTVQKLRLKRFLDGSDWKLSAYYHDGDDWVTDEAWVGIVDDQELYVYLSLSGKVGYLRWSDFLDTVGDPYPTAGFYESRTYDAGRSVDFTRISWNEVCPSGTDVSFQVAVSEDANGPWSYGSSLTTAAGTTITSTTGRYARFKVSMTSDGSDTPVINDVQVSHDGTSGSRVTRWSFDEAGNIVSQVRITDTGAEIDERSYNSLNQIETSSGGWSYQFDPDGNLIGKNNGTAEGCEKWEFTWNEDCNLVRLTKGIYDATSVLVNSFTVSYQYDETGRMLRRDDGTDVTDYFYDDWDIWKEVTGESVTEYLVPDGIIFSFLRDGELYVLHCDALSSARTVTDSEGAVVAQMEFDAWGQILPGFLDLVPGGMPMGFVGGLGVRTDSLTGLHCMRQRWYDPQLGRFLSRDPIGLKGGNNLYLYAANLPTSRTDESGLNWWEKLNKAQKVGRGGVQLAAELADEIYQNVIKIRDEVVIRTTGKKYIRLDAQVQSPKGKKNIEIKISKNPNTEIRGRRQLANQDLVTGCKDGELLMVPPEIATEELVAVRILKIVGKWVDKGLLGIIIAVGSARTCKATTLKGAAKELGHLTWDLGVYYLAGRAVIRFPALAPVAGGMLYVDLMKLAVGDDPLHQPIYPGTLTSVTGGEINYDY